MDRRDFLKKAGFITVAGMTIPLSALELLEPRQVRAHLRNHNEGRRWGFVVDTNKCVGCGMCVKACKTENEVPWEVNYSRTWVERYIELENGEVLIDSPGQARDGYTTNRPLGLTVSEEEITKGFFVPKLCNHCELPSCVEVCPVGATYKTRDGVVLVDRKWCIGCGYCITNCPYGARFFHPTLHVAEKCTWCYHRISQGMDTACVQACSFDARKIGDLNDPDDEVHDIVCTSRVAVLKPHTHNEPRVYYLGLDHIVV